jgi:hypothetical protein
MTAVRILPIGMRLTRDTITDAFVDGTISFYVGGTGNSSKTPITVYTDKDLATGARTTSAILTNGYPTYPNIWGDDSNSYDVGILATGYNGGVEKIIPYAELAVTADSGNTDTTPTFKNLFTNGSLYDWPGATTFSNVSGSGAAVEIADGIFFAQASTASNALTRQASDATDGEFSLRMGRPAASTNTNKLRIFQAVLTEDAYKCRGQNVTFSFTLKKGTNFSGTSVAILIATGTTEGEAPALIDASGWGGQVNILSATQVPTAAATRYEFSGAVATNVKEIGVQVAYTPSGTAGADDWVQIENLQFEIGAEATAFEYVPINTDHVRRNGNAYFRSLVDATDAATARATLGAASNASRIINGGMVLDQRNAGAARTFTAAAAISYCVDRFYGSCTGANVTGQRTAGSAPDRFRYRFTGAASVTQILFGQRIEAANIFDLASTTATFSVKLANSLLTTVTWTAYYANSADDFSAKTQIATGTFTVTSTLTTYSAQIALGANAINGVAIELTVGAQISGTWDITAFKLEPGSVATNGLQTPGGIFYEPQRYYEKSFNQTTAPAQNVGTNAGALGCMQVVGAAAAFFAQEVRYKVTKRTATPTMVYFNPSAANAQMRNAGTGTDTTGLATQSLGDSSFSVTATSAAGSTAGQLNAVHWTSEAEL